jgi:hypothetical protein
MTELLITISMPLFGTVACAGPDAVLSILESMRKRFQLGPTWRLGLSGRLESLDGLAVVGLEVAPAKC